MNETATAEAPKKLKFSGAQPGNGKKKGWIPPGVLLKSMRHVFQNNKKKDKNESERNCRAFFERDPSKFLEKLNQLENQHRVINMDSQDRAAKRLKEETGTETATEMDEGEERVRELLGLLKALYRERGYT